MKSHVALLLVAFAPVIVSGFVGQNAPRSFVGASSTSLSVGPLQKLTNKKEYEKTVQGLMQTKGYTREQAEKEYNKYLENPTNYALEKVCIRYVHVCRSKDTTTAWKGYRGILDLLSVLCSARTE